MTREQIIQIAQSLAGHVDLRTAVEAVSSELSKLVPHDHIDAAMLTPERDEVVVYETGIQTSWGDKRRKVDDSPIRDIFVGNTSSMIFEDALRDPRVTFDGSDSQPIKEFGLRARIHMKLEIAGTVIGALSLSARQIGVFHDAHLEALRVVANVIGPYFHVLQISEIARQKTQAHAEEFALRTSAEHLSEFQDQERMRIGMDLHDQVLADLSRLILKLDNDQLSDEQKVHTARVALIDAIQEVRNIVEDTRPTLLEMFGFGTAIEAHLTRATEGRKIVGKIATDVSALDELFNTDARKRLLLFRIAQEAINNAVSHSDATELTIDVQREGNYSRLMVFDNGCGLSIGSEPQKGGLRNMTVRAVLLRAQIDFATPDTGTGTCITVHLPQ
ncbi:MAG: ATP-binding protein [Paracoccaceae bacterium]